MSKFLQETRLTLKEENIRIRNIPEGSVLEIIRSFSSLRNNE